MAHLCAQLHRIYQSISEVLEQHRLGVDACAACMLQPASLACVRGCLFCAACMLQPACDGDGCWRGSSEWFNMLLMTVWVSTCCSFFCGLGSTCCSWWFGFPHTLTQAPQATDWAAGGAMLQPPPAAGRGTHATAPWILGPPGTHDGHLDGHRQNNLIFYCRGTAAQPFFCG